MNCCGKSNNRLTIRLRPHIPYISLYLSLSEQIGLLDSRLSFEIVDYTAWIRERAHQPSVCADWRNVWVTSSSTRDLWHGLCSHCIQMWFGLTVRTGIVSSAPVSQNHWCMRWVTVSRCTRRQTNRIPKRSCCTFLLLWISQYFILHDDKALENIAHFFVMLHTVSVERHLKSNLTLQKRILNHMQSGYWC